MSVKSQPLLAVADVLRSSRWYATLLDARALSDTVEDTHGNVYNRIYCGDELVLQLHSWDDEEHPNLVDRESAPPGHGVLVWFEVDDIVEAKSRATKLKARVLLDLHVNNGPRHHEMWLEDPDGYTVVLSDTDGSA